jgi:hypothetical protein
MYQNRRKFTKLLQSSQSTARMWSKLARNLPKCTKLRKSTPDWSKVPPGSGQNRTQSEKYTEESPEDRSTIYQKRGPGGRKPAL